MKIIIIKYGIILSLLLLINNYIQIIPAINHVLDEGDSGIIAVVIIASVLLVGTNAYVSWSYENNSYSYGNAVITGILISVLGASIFSVVSTTVLLINNIDIGILETILSRIFRFSVIGGIISLLIPLTYKSAKKD